MRSSSIGLVALVIAGIGLAIALPGWIEAGMRSNTASADDSATTTGCAKDSTEATPPALANNPTTTPNNTAAPEATPPALPVNELPLYPEARCIGVACKNPDSGSWDHDAALISVIVDGHKKECQIWGDKAEDLVSFKLRTDGWTHASVQFFGRNEYAENVFSSAVVLVPNKESLERWTKYYAERVAWARKCAAYFAAKRRGPSKRAYPGDILPPK